MKRTIQLLLFFCFAQIIFSQTSKTVEINAGGLGSALTETEKSTITHLTVTGIMNSNDFYFIRNNMPALTHLYLSAAAINDNRIPSNAFEGKKTLEFVSLPSTANRIESYAFYNSSGLKEVILPDSLQYIGYMSFYNCTNLEKISAMPVSLTFIDSNAFHNCSKLAGILVLPPRMTTIKSATFYNCSSLSQVVLPDSLQVIENSAFHYCSNLSGELIIPAKVTSIGANAFQNTWFTTCKIRPIVPPTIDVNYSSMGRLRVFFVPEESKTAYRTNSNWSRYVLIGGEEMVAVNIEMTTPGTLGEMILQQVEYLKDVNQLTISGQMNSTDMDLLKINLPDLLHLDFSKTNITDIPNSHFYDKANLSSIILPDSLTRLGERAFYRCYNLEKVVVPKKVKEILIYTFYDNYVLNDLSLPEGLVSIANYAFQHCHSLTEIVMPDSLNTIGYQAFYNNSRLKKVIFKDRLTSLSNDLFSACEQLEEVILPSGLTSIGTYTFYNCKSLSSITLPATLTSIGTYAFYNCSLVNLILPPGLHSLGASAFNNCTSLTYIQCQQPTPPPLSSEIFNNLDKTKCVLDVPFWSETMYKQANIWSFFGTITTFNTEIKEIPVNGPLALNFGVRPPGFPNVTIMSTGSLSVGGNAPFVTDNFEIFSRLNSNAWGSLINNCPAMSANAVRASFDVNANKWYFLSFPFDVQFSEIRANNNGLFVVRYYDGASRALNGATGNWKSMTGDSILRAGKGYIFNSNIATKVVFPAMETTRNNIFEFDIQRLPLMDHTSDTQAHMNWNFVGNPYPAYYDSRYIECTAPITVWNLSNNTYNAYSLVDDKYAVKPFEGFFVQKPNDLTQITFVPEGRLPSASIPDQGPLGAPVRISAQNHPNRLLINLEISDEEFSDRTRIVINELASAAYELAFDAAKFMSSEPSTPQLFSYDEAGTSYAINERPLDNGQIRLGFYVGKSGNFTLKSDLSAVTEGMQITLLDMHSNKEVSIVNDAYHFTSTAGIFSDRFVLRISGVVSGNEEISNPANFTALVNGQLMINTRVGTDITLFTVNGLTISQTVAASTNTFLTLPKGVYLVKVGDELFKSVVF